MIVTYEGGELLKVMLFGELTRKRPFCEQRCRDVVMSDLQAIGVRYDWYLRCQDRDECYAVCRDGVTQMAT